MDTRAAVASPPRELILRDGERGIATLTLNRPSARNALSTDLMSALQREVDAIATDPAVKVVIMAAAGVSFCAGHDLKELRARRDEASLRIIFGQCSDLMQSLIALPQPVIARVQGVATAAGCQLVATCDLAITADSARFATPGVDIGLFCSTPMVALTRCIGSKHAMQMLLTGEAIDAETAVRFGLVNAAVPFPELDAAVMGYARAIAAKPSRVLAIGKGAFYRQRELGLAEAYEYASAVMTRNMLMQDSEEGIDAFLEKREPRWGGR